MEEIIEKLKQEEPKIEDLIFELNNCKDHSEYHRIFFKMYEQGYNFTNHWKTINKSEDLQDFYYTISWSINPKYHDEAVRLFNNVLRANNRMKSLIMKRRDKEANRYFKKQYKLKLKLLMFLRNGHIDTFYNTHKHYIDVLHPSTAIKL